MNKNVIEYLKYYCNLNFSPEYAVLLRGPWGCGKTWFIKKYIKDLEDEKKQVLYVSLYGISDCSQIDDIIFQQLHPFASSKFVGLLGSAIKIASSRDLPKVNLKKIFKQIENSIIVFDDLERISMKIVDILGHINSFVEHRGNKVIILANEEEITEEKEYFKIKEKLIGETFQIKSNFSNAFESIISKVKSSELKKAYKESYSSLEMIYNEAKYDNLRHLKQSLWSFERLYLKFPKYMEKKEFFNKLLYDFLCFSFELKSGSMKCSHFDIIDNYHIPKVDVQSNLITGLFKKYNGFKAHEIIFPKKIWRDFFEKNEINIKEAEECLDNSEYFSSKTSPKWIQLWHFRSISSNSSFITLRDEVLGSLKSNLIDDVGELKHVFSMFLFFIKKGLSAIDKDELAGYANQTLESLLENGKLREAANNIRSFRINEGAHGLGFYESSSLEFLNFLKTIERKIKEAAELTYELKAKELLSLIETDPLLFYDKITIGKSEINSYYDIPVLNKLDVDKFYNKLISQDLRFVIVGAFKQRYSQVHGFPDLIEETDFLTKLKDCAERDLVDNEKILDVYFIKEGLLPVLIDELENLKLFKNNEMAKVVNA